MNAESIRLLHEASRHKGRIKGLTHNFYRYPARFSPEFVSTAIELFSEPGEVVLDPYMGGGTTVIEAMASGRRAIGADLNSLALFVTKVKTTPLGPDEVQVIRSWAENCKTNLSYHADSALLEHIIDNSRLKNMSLPSARYIKKIIAQALLKSENLRTNRMQQFVRCAILKTAQWALDGRRSFISVTQFREKLYSNVCEMLGQLQTFTERIEQFKMGKSRRKIMQLDSAKLHQCSYFTSPGNKASLVVTSPPYPGLHILYHRWQINGRRETAAPYWIANCLDGQGDSFYNFGSRHQAGLNGYFSKSLNTLRSIRKILHNGAHMIQLVAFSRPEEHLPRYLSNMEEAGFEDVTPLYGKESSILWRNVPNRKWYAALRGETGGSHEVVLVHKVR